MTKQETEQEEDILRKNNDRYSSLVGVLTDYIYTVLVKNGRVEKTIHSPGCIAITGYSPEDYDSNPFLWYNMIYEEDRAMVLIYANQALLGKEVLPFEHRIMHKDGTVRWVTSSIVPIYDRDGNFTGYDAFLSDVTGRKHAEEELKKYREGLEALIKERTFELEKVNEELKREVAERMQREEELRALNADLGRYTAQLEAVNRELEAFNYSASHVFRAPLRAIYSFSSILSENYTELLDEEGRRLLRIIGENAVKMGRYIEDILEFSGIGRRELEPVCLDMDTLARDALRDIEPLIAGRSVSLIFKEMPQASGDSGLIRRVFANLLSNAVKFTGNKTGAVIECGCMKEGLEKDGKRGCLGLENIYYIKDNGVGFDMLYAQKLFGVFQRLHGDEEFEGTGIGLAIVKRIIEKHGGRVWAEGRPGEGATFYFTLPVPKDRNK